MKKVLLLSLMVANVGWTLERDVDYSRCSTGLFGINIDNDGQLALSGGSVIKSKKIEDNVEKYVINMVVGGGIVNGKISTQTQEFEVAITRDAQGNITHLRTGGDSLSKNQIKSYKDITLNMLVDGTYNSAQNGGTFGFGSYPMGGFGGWGGANANGEPTFFVDGQMVTLRNLTQDQKKSVGLSDETYDEMFKTWKKDKKTKNKLRKNLAPVVENAASVMFLGTDSDVSVKDGVCLPEKNSVRFYNTKTKEVSSNQTFSAEACDTISTLYKKHQAKINTCNNYNAEINKDMFANAASLGQGFGNAGIGMGGGPGMGLGGGMGMVGYGISGNLESQYMNCSYMLGYDQQHGKGALEKSGSNSGSTQN